MIRPLACLSIALLALTVQTGPARAQDVASGEKLFKQHCGNCHVTERGKEKVGPSLFGVTGMGGPFTDVAELDRYLESPRTVVPDTQMPFPGLKDARQRKDLIAYLDQFK